MCINENRKAIDRDIIKGLKYKTISSKYGVSESSVKGHKLNHVKMREIMAEEEKRKWTVESIANEILEISIGSAKEARAGKIYGPIGSILSNPTKICEILSKTSDAGESSCGLAEMRLELKLMRDKTPDEPEIIE